MIKKETMIGWKDAIYIILIVVSAVASHYITKGTMELQIAVLKVDVVNLKEDIKDINTTLKFYKIGSRSHDNNNTNSP